MKIYSPEYNSVSGYGRIAAAAKRAINGIESPADQADIAVCNPSDPSTAPVRLTAWESNALPPEYVGWRRAKLLIVPCEHNKQLFRQYSRVPIEVLPQFADTTFEHLPPARPFSFICIARDNGARSRKGVDELLLWFTAAFPIESDVRLTVKMSPHCSRRYTPDSRITLIYEDYKRSDYISLLKSHHCGVFLSGMEGWNLPLCELMGMGRPSIIIPLAGPADFTTPETSWYLKYKLVKAPQNVYLGAGKVGYPYMRSTIQAMQSAYADQLLVAEKGLNSAKAAAEYTETRFAAKLRNILKRYEFPIVG